MISPHHSHPTNGDGPSNSLMGFDLGTDECLGMMAALVCTRRHAEVALEHYAKVTRIREIALFGDFRHRELAVTKIVANACETYAQYFVVYAATRDGLESHLKCSARDVQPLRQRLHVEIRECVQANDRQRLLHKRVAVQHRFAGETFGH